MPVFIIDLSCSTWGLSIVVAVFQICQVISKTLSVLGSFSLINRAESFVPAGRFNVFIDWDLFKPFLDFVWVLVRVAQSRMVTSIAQLARSFQHLLAVLIRHFVFVESLLLMWLPHCNGLKSLSTVRLVGVYVLWLLCSVVACCLVQDIISSSLADASRLSRFLFKQSCIRMRLQVEIDWYRIVVVNVEESHCLLLMFLPGYIVNRSPRRLLHWVIVRRVSEELLCQLLLILIEHWLVMSLLTLSREEGVRKSFKHWHLLSFVIFSVYHFISFVKL